MLLYARGAPEPDPTHLRITYACVYGSDTLCLKCVYAAQSLRTARARWRRRLAVAARGDGPLEAEGARAVRQTDL